MPDQLFIAVNDRGTADVLQQKLTFHGIGVSRLNAADAIKFGIKLSAGKGLLQVSPQEILQLLQIAPSAVDALFDTLEGFRDRINVFVNGQPRAIPTKSSLTRKLMFEDFIKGR